MGGGGAATREGRDSDDDRRDGARGDVWAKDEDRRVSVVQKSKNKSLVMSIECLN